MGTIAVQYMSYQNYPKTSHPGAFGSSFITAGFALKTTDLANSRGDLFGPELADYMKRAARHLAGIKTFGEEQPNIENRVELTSAKDEYGMPLGKLIHTYDQDAVALWNANLEEGLKVAKAAGAKEAWSGRGSIPTSHLMGGAIMGTSCGQFRRQQLWPEPRNPQPLDSRTRHLPDRRRLQSDIHHLRGVAARRRADGVAMGNADELGTRKHKSLAEIVMPGLVPGIHVLAAIRKTWMAGTKPGHDENAMCPLHIFRRPG